MRLQGINDADQTDIGQARQHTCMIAAHHAGADHTDAKTTFRLGS
jgi:hypothetical protein